MDRLDDAVDYIWSIIGKFFGGILTIISPFARIKTATVFTLVLLIIKLIGLLNLTWFWVFSPFALWLILVIIIVTLFYLG